MNRTLLMALFSALLGGPSLYGSLIVSQDTGADHLAFEAEVFGAQTSHYEVLGPSTSPNTSTFNAAEGLWAKGATEGANDSPLGSPTTNSTITYTLRFDTAGTYDFYLRGFRADSGSSDPAIVTISEGSTQGANDSAWAPDDLGTGGTYTGTYTRENSLLPTTPSGWSSFGTYTVTAGQDYTFAFSYREDGQFWDRFGALRQGSGLTQGDFDSLANSSVIPEPGTLSILLFGLSLLALRRRRR